MPYSIFAYAENNTPDGTFQAINPVDDETITTVGEFIRVKALLNIIGGQFFGGALAQRAYFESPKLRQTQYFEITPVEVGGVVAEATAYRVQPDSPIVLPLGESIRCYYEGGAGAARRVTGLLWLSDGPITPITGEIIHGRCTATITEVVSAWAHGEIVFEQPLAKGKYQVVGARCQCVDDGVAFRLIPVEGGPRPGGLAVNGAECPDLREQRNGGLGVWMEFEDDSPPELEVIAFAGGDAAQELTLDLIQIE